MLLVRAFTRCGGVLRIVREGEDAGCGPSHHQLGS